MKTLDEVIKARKICDATDTECDGCPYDREWHFEDGQTTSEVVSCMKELNEDTIHYLEEYNWMDKALDPSKRDKNENA
jgi:hypothetical protein